MRPVLVLRALGLGDALTAVPALRGLRRGYGDRPLLLAGTEPVSGWLCRLGLADGAVPTQALSSDPPGRSLGPHTAVNLHGRGPQSHRLLMASFPDELIAFDCPEAGFRSTTVWRPGEHEVDRWRRLSCDAGGTCSAEDLRLEVPRTRLPGTGGAEAPVLVHPGAASRARQWPADRWAAVVSKLTADGQHVVLTGSGHERELCSRIQRLAGACLDTSGELTLEELAGVVAGAGLLVSGDTGVAHLATAVGTRSVTLFGPTPPAWWGPAIDQELHSVLYHGDRPGDPHADEPDPALLRIAVDDVLEAARRQLR